jgi:HAD superfamily phosphoserine phosphatase-like hydrolase
MKKKKLAIFDIDGTIFRKNLHFELLDELVYMKILDKSVRRDLVKAYGHWLNHEGTYEEYRDKLVSLYGINIKGCKEADIVEASKTVARFNSKRTYIFSLDLIRKLSPDHVMLVISGSPMEIVREYASIFKFDAYYGSVYETDDNGVYTGKAVFEPTRNKGSVVMQYAAENGLTLKNSVGIGDTESDASFLGLVDEPIAFNPNINLKQIAEKNSWRIVVEKKDVIYEI